MSSCETFGLTIGADVPVFVLGESCFASGIGEELKDLHLAGYAYFNRRSPDPCVD